MVKLRCQEIEKMRWVLSSRNSLHVNNQWGRFSILHSYLQHSHVIQYQITGEYQGLTRYFYSIPDYGPIVNVAIPTRSKKCSSQQNYSPHHRHQENLFLGNCQQARNGSLLNPQSSLSFAFTANLILLELQEQHNDLIRDK